jgi:hypothetical protein
MGVPINEAGRDDMTLGINLVATLGANPAYLDDAITQDADVRPEAGGAGTIDNRPVPDNEVVHGLLLN